MKLYKTTIVILSDFNPDATDMNVEDLARDAMNGDSYLFSEATDEINCTDLEGEGVKEFFNCLEADHD